MITITITYSSFSSFLLLFSFFQLILAFLLLLPFLLIHLFLISPSFPLLPPQHLSFCSYFNVLLLLLLLPPHFLQLRSQHFFSSSSVALLAALIWWTKKKKLPFTEICHITRSFIIVPHIFWRDVQWEETEWLEKERHQLGSGSRKQSRTIRNGFTGGYQVMSIMFRWKECSVGQLGMG